MDTRNINDEETQLDLGKSNVRKEENNTAPSNGGASGTQSAKKRTSLFGKAAAGLGVGVLLGSTTSFVMANAMSDDAAAGPGQDDGGLADAGNITDGSVQMASGISDDMSFSDAFSAARAELGPGGAFEWHGNVYSTYTAEEWNNMSEEEKDDYFSHFNWNSSSDAEQAAEDDAAVEEEPVQAVSENIEGDEVAADEVAADEETPENSVSAEQVDAEGEVIVSENQAGETVSAEQVSEDGVEVLESTPEVEVLGVEHDPETGSNYAGLMVDDQEVVLIDVDGTDNQFDYMAADLNNDGQITDDEIADISDQHIEVSQFENDLYASDPLFASADDVSNDYINEDSGCDMA